MSQPCRFVFAFCLVVLAACGGVRTPDDPVVDGDVAGDGDVGVDGANPPGTASVLAVDPATGALGVLADATITVTFSEAMDQASVEAAWQSTDLPATAVGFAWNAAGDALTVTPKAPLELAEGSDPATVVARAYTFGIATTAKALDGGALATPLAVTFHTARRIRITLAAIGTLTRSMRGDGVVFGETAVTMVVGDTTGDLQTKTYVTFALPTVPAGATIESATLAGSQNSINGVPFSLGALHVLHTSVATMDAAAFGATPLGLAGDLATDPSTGTKRLDVRAELADDLANHQARKEHTQYRLEFQTPTNSNGIADEARYSRSGFSLAASYLLD
jgi:hypothetical protein